MTFADELREQFPDADVRENVMLRDHTTFQIGGPADVMAAPRDAETLEGICARARGHGVPVTVLGGGSNLLVSDAGVRGMVLLTSALSKASADTRNATMTARCGARLSKAALTAYDAGLSGLAFAHGIPGTVGGAVYMNAGAYGGEMSRIVASTEYLTPEGEHRTLDAAGHGFGYRSSWFSRNPGNVILNVTLKLSHSHKAAVKREMAEYGDRRREKQPLDQPSAGSVFKRPEGSFAGKLIEECGMKGFCVGGAQVSEKHAGFIINRGGATCRDVLALIDAIRESVQAHSGVLLEPEIRVVGEENWSW